MSTRARRSLVSPPEILEARLALSTVAIVGDILTITGTDAADKILIGRVSAHFLNVKFDGKNLGTFGPVNSIAVNAGGGNDFVQVGPKVQLPAILHGGDGNDTLQGGSGSDQLYGDDGNDRLITSAGLDSLNSGQGDNRVTYAASLGTIQVSPSASGDTLRLLKKAYTLRKTSAAGMSPGPIVVGAADLTNPAMVSKLVASYKAGQTVAIADATLAAADQLSELIGHDSPASWSSAVPEAALVAYRKVAIDGVRTQSETTVVLPPEAGTTSSQSTASGARPLGLQTLEDLTSVFAAVPPVATPPDGTPNLVGLANSYVNRSVQEGTNADSVQLITTTYGVRSFQNKSDFYYVFQEGDFFAGKVTNGLNSAYLITNFERAPAAPGLLQTSPQTTFDSTSVTSGVSYSIGGSIGYNQMQGFNASVSGGVTISKSTTTVFPPVDIRNMSDIVEGAPLFTYRVRDGSLTQGTTLTFYDHFIWEVPFSDYSEGQPQIAFTVEPLFFTTTLTNADVEFQSVPIVPLPFGNTYSLQAPAVTGITAPRTILGVPAVSEGGQFTISGTAFYPSLVTGILIGGVPLATANYSLSGDGKIVVTAPDQFGVLPQSVVVQTTEGSSNSNMNIIIY